MYQNGVLVATCSFPTINRGNPNLDRGWKNVIGVIISARWGNQN